VAPRLSLAPAKRVSYPSIESFTPSRLSTESGLERRDAASTTVRKVLLCASRLKDEKIRVKRR
jgi:hypothetical protein